MRNTLPILFLLLALAACGCQTPPQSDAPAPTAAEGKPAPKPSAQTATQVEAALKMARRPFARSKIAVTDEQLEGILASSYEVFESTEAPKVRIFVFHYDAQELVKPAKIARWINESGLIHHGQTSANRLRVIVAGAPTDEAPDEETTQAMNDFMDAFMVMR